MAVEIHVTSPILHGLKFRLAHIEAVATGYRCVSSFSFLFLAYFVSSPTISAYFRSLVCLSLHFSAARRDCKIVTISQYLHEDTMNITNKHFPSRLVQHSNPTKKHHKCWRDLTTTTTTYSPGEGPDPDRVRSLWLVCLVPNN